MNYITRHPSGTIIEADDFIVLPRGLYYVMNHMALHYGSSLQGRVKSAQHILHITQSVPLYINPITILIPSHSLRHPQCHLINMMSVLRWQGDQNRTTIFFENGKTVSLKISGNLFAKRLSQARQLERHIHQFSQKESVYTMV